MFVANDEYLSCCNEQQFKMRWLKRTKNKSYYDRFCIETEETVKGFPDVIEIHKELKDINFYEFKFTKTGIITFKPTQIGFYREYPSYRVQVLAYNKKTRTLHFFFVEELFNPRSAHYIGTGNKLNLNIIEQKEK